MLDHLDRSFAALADPGRRAMMARLASGPATVSELGAPLDMTLSAVLQHVTYLADAGLVVTRKEGRTRVVELARGGLDDARRWMASHDADAREGAAAASGEARQGSALDILFGGPDRRR